MRSAFPVAVNGDQWIALAGVIAGAIGAVAGLLFGYFNGRAERSEARLLARGTRLHAQRLDAYVELAAFLERERLYIARTEPVIAFGEGEPPPEPLSDNEWLKMQARVAVAGTPAVDAAVKSAQQRARAFVGAASVPTNCSTGQ